MKFIEIKSLENGAHNNQVSNLTVVPEGYAVIPEDMETENFPFGDIEVKEIDGVLTVIKWIPLPIPETDPIIPEPDPTLAKLAEQEAQITDLQMALTELYEMIIL